MDAKSHALLQKLLKDSNYSMTTPRKIVCELLWGQEPMSMHELTMQSKDKIDRASLYRTIGLFERLGLVQRIYIGWKYKIELSDVFTHHHHHLSCLVCGKIIAITEEDEIEKLITALAKRHDFTPKSHQLEVSGYCAACGNTATAN
jgi:Fur family ferric uptake transcriptional regulator